MVAAFRGAIGTSIRISPPADFTVGRHCFDLLIGRQTLRPLRSARFLSLRRADRAYVLAALQDTNAFYQFVKSAVRGAQILGAVLLPRLATYLAVDVQVARCAEYLADTLDSVPLTVPPAARDDLRELALLAFVAALGEGRRTDDDAMVRGYDALLADEACSFLNESSSQKGITLSQENWVWIL